MVLGAANVRLSGLISGPSTTSLTKTGTGTLSLSGANTYDGDTFINSGAINIGANTANGSVGNGIITLNNTSKLTLQKTGTPTISNNIVISNNAGQKQINTSSAATLSGSITNNSTGSNLIFGGTANITLNNLSSSFTSLVGGNNKDNSNTIILNFPANANIPCVNLCGATGSGSNTGNTKGIRFLSNNNQLSSTCFWSVASNRAYNRIAFIDLNGTNQTCAGIVNTYCVGTKYASGNRGAIRNGHATVASTLTITNTVNCSDQGAGFKAITNGGAAVLNVIKNGLFTQTFFTDSQVTFTGFLNVTNGLWVSPLPSTTDIRISVAATAPTSTSGSANSGSISLSTASPNLSGKTINVTCSPANPFTYTLMTWPSGTPTTLTTTFRFNGALVLLGLNFTSGSFTGCNISISGTSLILTIA